MLLFRWRHAPRSVVSKNSKLVNENVQNNYLAPSSKCPHLFRVYIRIPGVIRKSGESQLQIDNFKWHLPLIYTHCFETFWRRFMRFNTLHHNFHVHKMLQNCWRKSFLNTQNPGASGGDSPQGPYQGSALNPLETLSGPQTPRRLSSPLTQNPGSAPDLQIDQFTWSIYLVNLPDQFTWSIYLVNLLFHFYLVYSYMMIKKLWTPNFHFN